MKFRSSVASRNLTESSFAPIQGAQPEGGDYTALAAFGVKTVIDLQRDGDASEQQRVESAGMTFHKMYEPCQQS